MRSARVLYKDEEAGVIIQLDDGSFEFKYHKEWVNDSSKPPISLTLPKTETVYEAPFLFPYFFHMLPEGRNKESVCYNLRIDQEDYFGILLASAGTDTIGAVRLIGDGG